MRFLWAFCVICVIYLTFSGVHAQENPTVLTTDWGLPLIKTWTKKDYGVPVQVWDVVQDRRGIMYFATFKGILEFDGNEWRLIPAYDVRKLAYDSENDLIYVGTQNEFGFLSPDASGNLQFQSLFETTGFQPGIYNTSLDLFVDHSGVYFLTSQYLFHYQNQQIKALEPVERFDSGNWIDGRLIVNQSGVGLMELSDGKFRLIKGGEKTAGLYLRGVFSFDESLLVVTRHSGLWKLRDGQLESLPLQSKWLQEDNIFSCDIV